jgi:hypothetical protein
MIEPETKNNSEFKFNFERTFGIILLIPPVIGVLLFLIGLMGTELKLEGLSDPTFWSGNFASESGGGYSSPMPMYLGLMAIAGAILIKNSNKN